VVCVVQAAIKPIKPQAPDWLSWKGGLTQHAYLLGNISRGKCDAPRILAIAGGFDLQLVKIC